MANLIPAEQEIAPIDSPESDLHGLQRNEILAPSADSGSPWNLNTISALLLLVALWAVKLYTTWGAWGNLTVDSGHEMYVPAMLAEGKQLYRDLWFPFGPAGPYFTSWLFRVFGARLSVLYWAGSLSALGSAIFLYLTGMRLSFPVAGWTAGAVVLLEAFQPSMFSFPLPYSSPVVYGCLTGCVFLWLIANATFSRHWAWMLSAGTTAGVALLLKPEFGLAAYGCLGLLFAARLLFEKSPFKNRLGNFATDVLAMLPGVALCGFVIRWMVSIAGAEFITQENIQSWPTSYFMRTYAKTWLDRTGFTVSGPAFLDAFHRTLPVAAALLAVGVLLRWRDSGKRAWVGKALIVFALGWYLAQQGFFLLSVKQSLTLLFSTVFFPRDMVLYTILAAAAAWCYFCWKPETPRHLALPLIFTFSGLLAFRVLMKMNTTGYPVFYNGPVALSYFLLLCMIVPRASRSRRFVFLAELALCLACLFPVFVHSRANEAEAKEFVPFATDRGTIRVPEKTAEGYQAAIQFMKEKAALGQSVLSVPEDTSLYFLSGTICPTRVYLFIPGAVAPGKMADEAIREIERKPVDYLLWSNRTFSEYGAKEFGKDFNPEIGDYLKSHYHAVGPLLPGAAAPTDWTAVVWERNSAMPPGGLEERGNLNLPSPSRRSRDGEASTRP
jgi:hypothetical protein